MQGRTKKDYELFVCPSCWNQLNKCTCECYPPHNLIFIDRKMQKVIKILNEKNYRTGGCCEGHYRGHCDMYIAFGLEHNFNIPEGFKYLEKRRTIIWEQPKKITLEEYIAMQDEHIETLLKWANNLTDKTVHYDLQRTNQEFSKGK